MWSVGSVRRERIGGIEIETSARIAEYLDGIESIRHTDPLGCDPRTAGCVGPGVPGWAVAVSGSRH
jgi:hypothetical protein